MPNRRYHEVQSRTTVPLFPPRLDDYIADDNPVRALDAYVAMLDLQALGFCYAEARSGSGQPPFDPAILLKLSMYGYQNQIRRSRRLEVATRVNIEVMWLCQNARPSSKTIADFRKNNAKALKRVNRAFVSACRKLSLVGGQRAAVDGTFLKASAHRKSVHTKDSLSRGLARLDKLIDPYYRAMDEADATEPEGVILSIPTWSGRWRNCWPAVRGRRRCRTNWTRVVTRKFRRLVRRPACCARAARVSLVTMARLRLMTGRN